MIGEDIWQNPTAKSERETDWKSDWEEIEERHGRMVEE